MLHSNVPMLTMSSATLQKWVRESARVAGMVNKQSSRSEMAKLIRKMLRGVLITWGGSLWNIWRQEFGNNPEMEGVILNYTWIREVLEIVIFWIPKMLFLGLKKKGKVWFVSFGPIMALTICCILIIHAILNWGLIEKHPICSFYCALSHGSS